MSTIELLTTREAAKRLRLSKSTLDAWRCQGIGPKYCKIGRTVRYTAEELNAYIAATACRHTGE
ncbi:transcriptional regulator, AlpA family [Pseudovibrio denitrificans]|uniref:Transcriptional regulator, AlpA family n=1 Tax=Pseudovibrio denitrificans TaxID=258256 RepID=A0A1I6Y1L1_9HYPH|nr:helix-turn-helix domain-containing protein [Pseudovibrio denitrificans]SFT44202.1 transcriptional regulator, AlpA family [Pseudovibrio denitrificans]